MAEANKKYQTFRPKDEKVRRLARLAHGTGADKGAHEHSSTSPLDRLNAENGYVVFGQPSTNLTGKEDKAVVSFQLEEPTDTSLSISRENLVQYQQGVQIYLRVAIDDNTPPAYKVMTIEKLLSKEELKKKNKDLLEALDLLLETKKSGKEPSEEEKGKILAHQHRICIIGTVPVFHEWLNQGENTVGLQTLTKKRDQTVMSMPAWPMIEQDQHFISEIMRLTGMEEKDLKKLFGITDCSINGKFFKYSIANYESIYGKGKEHTGYESEKATVYFEDPIRQGQIKKILNLYQARIQEILELQVATALKQGKKAISVTVPKAFLRGLPGGEDGYLAQRFIERFETALIEVANKEENKDFKFYLSNAQNLKRTSKDDHKAQKKGTKLEVDITRQNIIVADCDSAEINRYYGADGKANDTGGADIALSLVPHPFHEVGNGCFGDAGNSAGDERFARLCPLVQSIMGASRNALLEQKLKEKTPSVPLTPGEKKPSTPEPSTLKTKFENYFQSSFETKANIYGFHEYKGETFFDVARIDREFDLVVINAGNSSWQLNGSGLNRGCNKLYKSHHFKEQERVFSLRSEDGSIGCDLLVVKEEGNSFTHVYQVGPNFQSKNEGEAKKEIHKLLFSNYATFLALSQPEMKEKSVILSGVSNAIFAGALQNIKRIEKGANIVDYINALCFIQFSEELKDNNLSIYMNSGLSTAMKDIREHEQDVLKWIVQNIPQSELETLGITGNATTGYKLVEPKKGSATQFRKHLLTQHEDYREVIGKTDRESHISGLIGSQNFENAYDTFCYSEDKSCSFALVSNIINNNVVIKVRKQPIDYSGSHLTEKEIKEGKAPDTKSEFSREIKNYEELMAFLDEFIGEPKYFSKNFKQILSKDGENKAKKWVQQLLNDIEKRREVKKIEQRKQEEEQKKYGLILDQTIEQIRDKTTYQDIAQAFCKYRQTGADNLNTAQVIKFYKAVCDKIPGTETTINDFQLTSGSKLVLFNGKTTGEPENTYYRAKLKYKIVKSNGRNIILLDPQFLSELYNVLEASQTVKGKTGAKILDIKIQEALKEVFTKIKEKNPDANLSMVIPGPLGDRVGHFVSYVFENEKEYELDSSLDGRQEFSTSNFSSAYGTGSGAGFCGVHAVEAVLAYIDPTVELTSQDGSKKFKFSITGNKIIKSSDKEKTGSPEPSIIPSPIVESSMVNPLAQKPKSDDALIPQSCIEQLQNILSNATSDTYNVVKENLSRWLPTVMNAITELTIDFDPMVEQTKEQKDRAQILRAATVSNALGQITGVSRDINQIIQAFINGDISEELRTAQGIKDARPIIEKQLSSLPKDVRSPHGTPKFPCKDKIVLNDNGTTTVLFTFDRSRLGTQFGSGNFTIEITLPKGVLASPDLLDAIRAGRLSDYLEKNEAGIQFQGNNEIDKLTAEKFIKKFSCNCERGQSRE
ncbi:MAG: hypothetical protein PHY80_02985 [Rickettsiales bacterium]|nr:hypothetical protein [Rickettsiales bacterium]